MPENIEVETKELQEAIQELHEESREREEEEKRSSWTRWIGLTTAILAVFAAIGALQSGRLVNEALINQVKASDTWTEYQAARQKDHLYTLILNQLVDANASNPALVAAMKSPKPPKTKGEATNPGGPKAEPVFSPKSVVARSVDYRAKIYDEMGKEEARSEKAKELENEAAHELHKHHYFEYSVALIQVAIAIGAVSALTKVKSVWFLSLAAGATGIVLFAIGFLSK